MESITAVSILSLSFGIVVNSLPPSATLGMTKFLFLRAEAAISMLQLSLSKMSWIGGSSFQPGVFNFTFTALCAARMLQSSHPAAAACNELTDLEGRVKTCAYQLVRRSDQMVTNQGQKVCRPMMPRKSLEEPLPSAEEEISWISSFSLSRLLAYVEVESTAVAAVMQDESNTSTSLSKSRSQSVVSDCDQTAHSETAHLRAPILGGGNKSVMSLHPMLTFLLHEIIMRRCSE